MEQSRAWRCSHSPPSPPIHHDKHFWRRIRRCRCPVFATQQWHNPSEEYSYLFRTSVWETWADQHLLSGRGSQLTRSSSRQKLLTSPHRKPRPLAEPLEAENDSSSHTVTYARATRKDCCEGFSLHASYCSQKWDLCRLCGIDAWRGPMEIHALQFRCFHSSLMSWQVITELEVGDF